MSDKQLEALREWVRAEIQYALAQGEEGSDGYRGSAHAERDVAERLFDALRVSVTAVPTSTQREESNQ